MASWLPSRVCFRVSATRGLRALAGYPHVIHKRRGCGHREISYLLCEIL
jgi:hypothetical protein